MYYSQNYVHCWFLGYVHFHLFERPATFNLHFCPFQLYRVFPKNVPVRLLGTMFEAKKLHWLIWSRAACYTHQMLWLCSTLYSIFFEYFYENYVCLMSTASRFIMVQMLYKIFLLNLSRLKFIEFIVLIMEDKKVKMYQNRWNISINYQRARWTITILFEQCFSTMNTPSKNFSRWCFKATVLVLRRSRWLSRT
jgi:hypothetical protein